MLPETPAAAAALSEATRDYTPALLNHCVRSYLWGAMYGREHGITFDDELYYVSALLHDMGLTEAFDSHRLPFEEAGGHLAWVFGTAAGWPADRAARVEKIIVLHMRDDVSPAADPKAHLRRVAAGGGGGGRRPGGGAPGAGAGGRARGPRRGGGPGGREGGK